MKLLSIITSLTLTLLPILTIATEDSNINITSIGVSNESSKDWRERRCEHRCEERCEGGRFLRDRHDHEHEHETRRERRCRHHCHDVCDH